MKGLRRTELPAPTAELLANEQALADELRGQKRLNVDGQWKKVRGRAWMKREVLGSLRAMAGDRVRCMYCLDSMGSDIEHYRPKAVYPESMFVWTNLLLCCSRCGNCKGNRFEVVEGTAQMIDPTSEDPWESLDFDPETGNITARFDERRSGFMGRGVYTVGLLQLDRREEISEGYLRSWRRIEGVVKRLMEGSGQSAAEFVAELQLADEHGLVEWCFGDRGSKVEPMAGLRKRRSGFWRECSALVAGEG